MGKIEFSMENVNKCLCTVCAVQGTSSCVKDKLQSMQEKMSEDIDIASVIEPSDIPGMHCASGKTSCDDLYFHEECKCVECPVFKENDLISGEPVGYFCRDGKAK
ncbi:MAG TPA: DUF2769 domain-containing protein [Methanobacteriaceae archaeon]|nr:DUF2769 domain-containing protein [Methanobacteriaceae archaeon]